MFRNETKVKLGHSSRDLDRKLFLGNQLSIHQCTTCTGPSGKMAKRSRFKPGVLSETVDRINETVTFKKEREREGTLFLLLD